jgi:hypothetical protein
MTNALYLLAQSIHDGSFEDQERSGGSAREWLPRFKEVRAADGSLDERSVAYWAAQKEQRTAQMLKKMLVWVE